MKHLNKKAMLIVYLLLVGFCAIGGFYGTYKISQILNEKDEIKKQHPIPDVLLMDCDIEFTLSDTITKEILNKSYSKTHVPNGNARDLDSLPLMGFFDEDTFEKYPHSKKHFGLNDNIYKVLRKITIIGTANSINNQTIISFHTNSNPIKLAAHNRLSKESYFEVSSYIPAKKIFKGSLRNIQLIVEANSKSQYLLDLERISYVFITSPDFEIQKVENTVVKTFKTKYFRLKNVKLKDSGRYEGDLVQTSF